MNILNSGLYIGIIVNIIKNGKTYRINRLSGITAKGMIEADSETNNVTQIGKKPFFEICFLKKRIIPNGVKKIM